MNKELEEAKEQVQIFIDTGKEYFRVYGECYITEDELKSVEAVLQTSENSIPKQVLKDKMKDLKEQYKKALEENSTKAFILKCQIEIVQEVAEGK